MSTHAPTSHTTETIPPTVQGSIHIPANGRQKTDISSYETVLVDGELEGGIMAVKWLSIARGGKYSGKADVSYADVSGELNGELHCREKLIVRSTAHVRGTLLAGVIEIHPGALIEGTINSYGRGSLPPEASKTTRPSHASGGVKLKSWLSLWSAALVLATSCYGILSIL